MPETARQNSSTDAAAAATAEAAARRTILVRLSGEIATKAPATRKQFAAQLTRNIKDALQSHAIKSQTERRHDRILVECNPQQAQAACEVLARVFGVQALAVAEHIPAPSLEAVVQYGAAYFRPAIAGRSFAVRARRVGGRGDAAANGISRRDVEVQLGAALLPHSAGVNLSAPQTTARVELYQNRAYYYAQTQRGEAGLPLGSGGRAVALVSGGFDSAVAAWRMLRRGVALEYVFCNLGGRAHQQDALKVMRALAARWHYGAQPRLHALPFAEVANEIRAQCNPRYAQVLLKRRMLRAAAVVAKERGAHALVTGEAVAQVSSQTLANLRAINGAVELPVLRPLAGDNKPEIIREAERIGTAQCSAQVAEYCALTNKHPATAAKTAAVEKEEARLTAKVLQRALAEREVYALRAPAEEALLRAPGMPQPGAEARAAKRAAAAKAQAAEEARAALGVEEIPPDAVVVDLRTKAQYKGWHWPEALHLDFSDAMKSYESFNREKEYLFYCEYEPKSIHLAELARERGLRGYYFRGGAPAMRRFQKRAAAGD